MERARTGPTAFAMRRHQHPLTLATTPPPPPSPSPLLLTLSLTFDSGDPLVPGACAHRLTAVRLAGRGGAVTKAKDQGRGQKGTLVIRGTGVASAWSGSWFHGNGILPDHGCREPFAPQACDVALQPKLWESWFCKRSTEAHETRAMVRLHG